MNDAAADGSEFPAVAGKSDRHPPRPLVPRGRRRGRAPAVPITAAVVLGILSDRWWPVSDVVSLGVAAGCLLAWLLAERVRRLDLATLAIMLGCAALGASWHHRWWWTVATNHIAGYAREESQLIRVRGVLVDEPVIIPKPQRQSVEIIPLYDRTLCTLRCTELVEGTAARSVSGLARLELAGHALHARRGDEVLVVGHFSRPQRARNPGGFDFAHYLRSSGLHVLIRCAEPDALTVVRHQPGWLNTLRRRIRAACENLLAEQLSERTGPVAIAMLLGTRTGMSDELRGAFMDSGTMHILAISGSNVAILAGLLWVVSRLLGWGPLRRVCWILGGIGLYAFVADAQPPVLRAVLMCAVVLAGGPWYRRTSFANGLALAILGLLVWNPTHVFDVGAQLSFLAVCGLAWGGHWWSQRQTTPEQSPPPEPALDEPALEPGAPHQALRQNSDDTPPAFPSSSPLPAPRFPSSTALTARSSPQAPHPRPIPDDELSWPMIALRTLWRAVQLATVTTLAIWLFTLPLTLARFQLFSAIGFGVNLVLAPLVVCVLSCGYLSLATGLLIPGLPRLFLWGLDRGLTLMLAVIEWAADVPYGHLRLPGPPDWWLIGFYLVLGGIVLAGERKRWSFVLWRGLLLWVVIGLAAPRLLTRDKQPDGLRCTFLAVSHGVAVLVEFPQGQTLLYDAGQLDDATRAQRTIQQALWHYGHSHLDLLVLSHADADHYNAVAGLAETLPIGQVFVHPTFADFRQPPIVETCEALARHGVPIRFIWADDQLRIDPETTCRVLAPPVRQHLRRDNENSLVLAIEYAGRRILLTGDLEKEGLDRMLQQGRYDVDVMLAPHHGSLGANTRRLADWAAPEWIVSSGGRRDNLPKLQTIYGPETRILSTIDSGAISFLITPDGTIQLSRMLTPPRSNDRSPPQPIPERPQ